MRILIEKIEPDPKWEGMFTITYKRDDGVVVKRKHCAATFDAQLIEGDDSVFFEIYLESVSLDENEEILS